jgi:hypothetical protein
MSHPTPDTSPSEPSCDENHLEELDPCPFPSHAPNAKTARALLALDEMDYKRFDSVEALFADLRI